MKFRKNTNISLDTNAWAKGAEFFLCQQALYGERNPKPFNKIPNIATIWMPDIKPA